MNNSFVGLACSDGLYFQNKHVEKVDAANWASARRTLLHRGVEAAVIENGINVILDQGLAYNRCKVGVLTNIDPTVFVPESAIIEEKHLFNVYRTQVDVILSSGTAVLNAQDPMVAEISELSDGEVIFFSLDAAHPVMVAHLAKGGKAVIANESEIILKAGMEEVWRIQKSASSYIRGNVPEHRIANTLAAIGVAWGLNLPFELIEAGIETFSSDKAEV